MADETPTGISYRDDLKAWWPLYDHAPVKCMEFVRHGLPAVDVVADLCKRRRECVQAGGHAGFWPMALAQRFDRVHTFEPEHCLFECLVRNIGPAAAKITAHRKGLGASEGFVRFKSHVSAGSWRVDPEGKHIIPIVTIDSLALKHCDAILLDIEGYEVHALDGAVDTIERCRPVILVELLPRSRAEIDEWLQTNQYRPAARYGRDGIYTYRGR